MELLFYCALHYLKALAEIRDIDLGETHSEIEKHIIRNGTHPVWQ